LELALPLKLASEVLVPVKVAELFQWSESKGGEVTKRFLPPFSTLRHAEITVDWNRTLKERRTGRVRGRRYTRRYRWRS
jgi:hypothetical protein